jgi:hypothetical protein
MPTIFNVYPCALLMVMANAKRTGNWRRRRVKGIRSVFESVMLSRGMNTRWPFVGPVVTSASMTCYMSWMTMSLVPLTRPLVMLRNNMMGQPSCKCNSWWYAQKTEWGKCRVIPHAPQNLRCNTRGAMRASHRALWMHICHWWVYWVHPHLRSKV